MNGLYKLLMAFVMFAISNDTYAQLSDNEMLELMSRAKSHYELSGIPGPKIFKLNSNYILIDYEIMRSSMNQSSQARAAMLRATRSIGEYLNSAKNKSMTVYDTGAEETELFDKKQSDSGNMNGAEVGSETSSAVKEHQFSSTTEKFSDKVIQEAKSKIDGIQSLMKFKGPEEETVYCYFLMLSKAKAKKKH